VHIIQLTTRTAADIEKQAQKVLRGLGNPEPPLDLRDVRDLLQLDRAYYSVSDDGALRETISRLKVAGLQILKRPTILADAVRKLSLTALYLPDRKRILLDSSLPVLKHRWNEAHEIGHDVIPWHAGMMLGDTELTLTPSCHAQMEAEANYAAGQILFLGDRFRREASDRVPSITTVRSLKKIFGNTWTSTLWRFVEQAHPDLPMVALVSGHPHVARREADFDPAAPCKYCVQSASFLHRFGLQNERTLFDHVVSYCGAQKGGSLGEDDILLIDRNGVGHIFHFETFFNTHQALTLGVYSRPHSVVIVAH
jgi:Zn-dependent peptidase ImmA (M78 family)